MIKMKVPYYIVKIIEQFLKNRSFSVKVGAFVSARRAIKCGVPQGAVLSPTLFSIFINDIPVKRDKNKRYSLLFADDLVFFEIYKNYTATLEKRINKYLEQLEKWSNLWRVTFAPHKCNSLVFTKKQTTDQFDLYMYGQKIEQVNEAKFLGITFDSMLKFDTHIQNISKTCSEKLNLIRTLTQKQWKIDAGVLINIYKSLIRSIMEYSSFSINITSNKLANKLQIIQNGALRAIFHQRREFGNKNIHNLANMESIKERLECLSERFLERAEAYSNPMISELIEDYRETFASNAPPGKPTILCNSEWANLFL